MLQADGEGFQGSGEKAEAVWSPEKSVEWAGMGGQPRPAGCTLLGVAILRSPDAHSSLILGG